MNEMKLLNPYKITPVRERVDRPHFAGGKRYYMRFGPLVTSRNFRTATEAEAYGARVLVRWYRLYDAAIAAAVMTEQG